MADVNESEHRAWEKHVPPDKVYDIPSPLHPATAKMHEAMLRAAKNVIGIWETWIRERQR